MTHLPVFGSGFKDFDKFFVGFYDQFNRLAKIHDDITIPHTISKKLMTHTMLSNLRLLVFLNQKSKLNLQMIS